MARMITKKGLICIKTFKISPSCSWSKYHDLMRCLRDICTDWEYRHCGTIGFEKSYNWALKSSCLHLRALWTIVFLRWWCSTFPNRRTAQFGWWRLIYIFAFSLRHVCQVLLWKKSRFTRLLLIFCPVRGRRYDPRFWSPQSRQRQHLQRTRYSRLA